MIRGWLRFDCVALDYEYHTSLCALATPTSHSRLSYRSRSVLAFVSPSFCTWESLKIVTRVESGFRVAFLAFSLGVLVHRRPEVPLLLFVPRRSYRSVSPVSLFGRCVKPCVRLPYSLHPVAQKPAYPILLRASHLTLGLENVSISIHGDRIRSGCEWHIVFV